MVERSALFVSCRVGHGANRLAKGDGQMTETAVRLVIEAVQTSGRSMPYSLVFDGGTGLALRVLPSGLKTWLWQGRMRAGRVVRLTLGEWGQQGLSVRQARRLAAEVRSRVRAGRLDTGLTATTSEPRCRAF